MYTAQAVTNSSGLVIRNGIDIHNMSFDGFRTAKEKDVWALDWKPFTLTNRLRKDGKEMREDIKIPSLKDLYERDTHNLFAMMILDCGHTVTEKVKIFKCRTSVKVEVGGKKYAMSPMGFHKQK